ncbi:MAG: hypothetical protein J7M38_00835 [Armatimonadetes bacterium]|nr:hypothetical protein [Armatimonadota bacterium]
MSASVSVSEPVNIGSRLELLVDDYLIEATSGDLNLRLHHPVRREIVLYTDRPWEGNASAFCSVFKDGDLYRMYYRGIHYLHSGEPAQVIENHPWFLCYAESDDGIHWRRPNLGIFEFNGSTDNNIILTPDFLKDIGGDPAHTATFLDTNPACPPDQKYKIVVIGKKPRGMYLLGSPDGVHFSILSKEPLQTEGAFDSQNLMFWDPVAEVYREYHRSFTEGVRAIMTATSKDPLHFPKPQWLQYEDSPDEHLYTNEIQPYYRAPHILMGFPMRYVDRGWTPAILELPDLDERLIRARSHPRYGTAITDALFMTSRDGLLFRRWGEAFIRPGPRRHDSWVYGDNFIFWGMVETKSTIEDAPDEISLYATEGYWEGPGTSFRRYTIRVDGFVSANAPLKGGGFTTRPIIFEGGALAINAETSAAGGIRVEIQNPDGTPIEGCELDECPPIICDSLRHIVRWNYNGGDISALAGRPVRLRFELADADLYSFRFVPFEPGPDVAANLLPGYIPPKNRDREPFVAMEDDFQSVPAGTTPTDEDLDPKPRGEGSGWEIREGAPDRVQVLNDDPIGSGKPGDRHYLKIERRDENNREGGIAWFVFNGTDCADATRGIVEVSARIWVSSKNRTRVDIDALDNEPGSFTRRAFNVRFAPDGVVSYYREVENPLPELKLQTDAWQEVHIRADLDAGTFDLTVEGKTATGLRFGTDDVHRIRCIAFAPNSSNTTMYVDWVKIAVTP